MLAANSMQPSQGRSLEQEARRLLEMQGVRNTHHAIAVA